MTERTHCIYCNKEITTRSKEHVIQNALGGLLESTDICCADCNNFISKHIDAPFTKIFNPIISRIENFCSEQETTVDDVMIILGDAGINYFLNSRDEMLKSRLAELEITLFCIHGNHEARPWEAGDYDEVLWNGGIVYVEAEYPNILFAKDGEIYDFNGKKVIAIGGAYSVDKGYRLATGMRWYETEQPDDEIKAYVEAQLKKADWKVDIVLTHAAPIEAEPVWAFLPGTLRGFFHIC